MLKELFLSKKSPVSYSDETIDILRLIRSENVGPRTFTSLIKLFGSPKVAIANIGEFSIRGGRSKPIKVATENEVGKVKIQGLS
jgi:DNA processing protein